MVTHGHVLLAPVRNNPTSHCVVNAVNNDDDDDELLLLL